jgi:hypothetical protein
MIRLFILIYSHTFINFDSLKAFQYQHVLILFFNWKKINDKIVHFHLLSHHKFKIVTILKTFVLL